jgi:hypothetical protein
VQNNNKPHFFAELLTDCFAFGTIPIYLGNPQIGNFFDVNGIIIVNNENDIDRLELNEDLYYSKIDAMKNNLNKIHEMKMSDDYLYEQCLKLMEI